MIVIEITAPVTRGLTFEPGDRLIVSQIRPELQSLLISTKADGQHVARLVKTRDDDELAIIESVSETATTGRRRARAIEP